MRRNGLTPLSSSSSPHHASAAIADQLVLSFDAKDEGTRAVMVGAPRLADYLDDDDRAHFDAVCELLRREWGSKSVSSA